MLKAPAIGMLIAPVTGIVAAAAVPMPVAVVLVILTAVGVWGAMMGLRIMAARRRLEVKTEVLRGRTRTLENILAVSARINATRNLAELADKLATAVEEVTGFRRVILYLWSDATKAFEARSFAGITPDEQAHLAGAQILPSDYDELSREECRYSNCYFLDPPGTRRQTVPCVDLLPDSRKWKTGQRLIAPLASSGGDVVGYLDLAEPASGLVPDPAAIRQLEFLTRQATTAVESAEVYDHLARKNADLSVASEKLNSLAEMKKNFVANVSHELRTPLTSISAYTELLQKNLNTLAPESLDEFLEVIHDESVKLTGIINDILDLSQMENNRPSMKQVDTDLVALVKHLEDSWTSRARKMNIKFKLDAGAEVIQLALDPLLIQQMLTHLVGNAFKFTPAGGQVRVGLQETGTAVCLTVQDTGIGIPADKLGDIFESFYQVDSSATRRHNGQGVGLAICKDIVVHHDGRIWAENVEPQGARITVLLPRRPAVLQPADPVSLTSLPFEAGEFVQRLMHWVSESLGIQVAALMVPDPTGNHLTIRAAIGLPESVVQSARVRRGAGFAGRVWESGETLLVNDLTRDTRFRRELNEPRYSTPSLLCVPLKDGDEVVAVISVNNKVDRTALDTDDMVFLESLAPRLTRLLTRYESWQDGARDFEAIRDTLRSTTAVGHMRHESLLEVCQEICLASARRVMLPGDELEHLAFSLQFYDVGLDSVPAQVLSKPGRLNEEERRHVEKHVDAGLGILESLQLNAKVRQLILHHHENFDGSGYPVGLAGEAIPLGSRLIRLADTLSSLLNHRPWRPSMGLDEAMDVIRGGIGREYCPRMSEVFLDETEARRQRIVDLQDREGAGTDLKRLALDHGVPVPVEA
ncbi:MAG: HD domain-containing phosphohydrolase [Candidatus Krumholzibacteriota bacterium]